MTSIQREITIHKRLRHPHIVRMYESFVKDKNLYIILEFMDKGYIYSMMQDGRVTEDLLVRIMSHILSALDYIHGLGLLHRDIKPENILWDKDQNFKLCDFGFTAGYQDKGVVRKTMCGTEEYLAPEVIKSQPQTDKLDIWCMGILLYELLFGKTPFFGCKTPYLMFEKMENKEFDFPSPIKDEYRRFIDMCLDYHPHKRPTVRQLLDAFPVFRNDGQAQGARNTSNTTTNTTNTNNTTNTSNTSNPNRTNDNYQNVNNNSYFASSTLPKHQQVHQQSAQPTSQFPKTKFNPSEKQQFKKKQQAVNDFSEPVQQNYQSSPFKAQEQNGSLVGQTRVIENGKLKTQDNNSQGSGMVKNVYSIFNNSGRTMTKTPTLPNLRSYDNSYNSSRTQQTNQVSSDSVEKAFKSTERGASGSRTLLRVSSSKISVEPDGRRQINEGPKQLSTDQQIRYQPAPEKQNFLNIYSKVDYPPVATSQVTSYGKEASEYRLQKAFSLGNGAKTYVHRNLEEHMKARMTQPTNDFTPTKSAFDNPNGFSSTIWSNSPVSPSLQPTPSSLRNEVSVDKLNRMRKYDVKVNAKRHSQIDAFSSSLSGFDTSSQNSLLLTGSSRKIEPVKKLNSVVWKSFAGSGSQTGVQLQTDTRLVQNDSGFGNLKSQKVQRVVPPPYQITRSK